MYHLCFVLVAPDFKDTPMAVAYIWRGYSSNLTAFANGEPEPRTTWYRHGTQIGQSDALFANGTGRKTTLKVGISVFVS